MKKRRKYIALICALLFVTSAIVFSVYEYNKRNSYITSYKEAKEVALEFLNEYKEEITPLADKLVKKEIQKNAEGIHSNGMKIPFCNTSINATSAKTPYPDGSYKYHNFRCEINIYVKTESSEPPVSYCKLIYSPENSYIKEDKNISLDVLKPSYMNRGRITERLCDNWYFECSFSYEVYLDEIVELLENETKSISGGDVN